MLPLLFSRLQGAGLRVSFSTPQTLWKPESLNYLESYLHALASPCEAPLRHAKMKWLASFFLALQKTMTPSYQ